MNITDQILQKGEYYQEVFTKDVIYLHHTAGGHRPDWTISGWDTDDDEATKKARVVGTAFVVGGKSTVDLGDDLWDGNIFRAFDEKLWAHHLGTKLVNNGDLNRHSIGIEICNYGPIKLGSDGKFYNYVNKQVPANQVIKLDKSFRGYTYYHAYTDKQIASVKELILYLKSKFSTIPLKSPLVDVNGYELYELAKKGYPGIYSHSNVRSDKFDLSPQPNMIEMLKSICK
jgi:hypothetical protein